MPMMQVNYVLRRSAHECLFVIVQLVPRWLPIFALEAGGSIHLQQNNEIPNMLSRFRVDD
jgi:hypothetical protein